jgi:hypothetical protein
MGIMHPQAYFETLQYNSKGRRPYTYIQTFSCPHLTENIYTIWEMECSVNAGRQGFACDRASASLGRRVAVIAVSPGNNDKPDTVHDRNQHQKAAQSC